MTTQITTDEWIAELQRIQGEQNPDGFSTQELAATLNCCPSTARIMIKQAITHNELHLAGTRTEKTISGRNCRIPIYRTTEHAR